MRVVFLAFVFFQLMVFPCLSEEVLPVSVDECTRAGGKISQITECDGSQSDWCEISEQEQCYADQVKEGRCAQGEYDEELGGIVGITPKVLCD